MEGGPPSFPQDFTCLVVLRMPLRVRYTFRYVTVTLFGPAFQQVRVVSGLVTLLMRSYNPHV